MIKKTLVTAAGLALLSVLFFGRDAASYIATSVGWVKDSVKSQVPIEFQIERARRDGRWDAAYEAQSSATVPDDLRAELDRNPAARAFFATLDGRNRYAILYRLQDAKKPETAAEPPKGK